MQSMNNAFGKYDDSKRVWLCAGTMLQSGFLMAMWGSMAVPSDSGSALNLVLRDTTLLTAAPCSCCQSVG